MVSANFPAIRTGYAEPKEKAPLVAVMDNFRDAESQLAHGEICESVMMLHGGLKDEEIQRLHAESGPNVWPQDILEAPSDQVVSAYDTFTTEATVSFFNMVSDNLQLVLDQQPSVRVINQSQSQTPVRLMEPLLQPLFEQAEFRERVAQGLGLDPASEPSSIVSQLLSHTETVLKEDPAVEQARERYTATARAAYEHGILNVIAGGNQGALANQLQSAGVVTSQDSYRSILLNDYVTVVGAATKAGERAALNSPNAGVEVYALGEGVTFKDGAQVLAANGTSVATPLIASQAAHTIRQHPQWSAAQLKQDILAGPGA